MKRDVDVDRLITKSIRAAVVAMHDPSRQNRVQGTAMLQAFSDVAADVIGLVMAPGGWHLAVAEAVQLVGTPPTVNPTDPSSITAYESWMASAVAAVRKNAGLRA